MLNGKDAQARQLTEPVEAFKIDSGEYRNPETLKDEEGKRRLLRSVTFCCISTGAFRFPPERAAQIAVKTVRRWPEEHEGTMERMIFNTFTDSDRETYEHLLLVRRN